MLEAKLCRRLLDLGRQRELEPFLEEALGLIVEIIGVRHGYLELYDDSGEPQWSIASGFTEAELQEVRQLISRGIIAAAISSGETIVTASAREDLRFSNRDSVRLGGIEAVLCAPIGDGPPRGVLYLQGGKQPGVFPPEERELAELFARQLGTLANRLLEEQRRSEQTDATKPIRKQLRAEGIVGRSKALADTLHQASLVAPLGPGSGVGKMRKDLQAFFEDQFDDCALNEIGTPSFPATAVTGKCLFDIKKVKELCNPMDKTAVQSPRETSATIIASSATTPRSLLCYQPKLARKLNNANTASLADASVGDDIEPGQAKHKKRGTKTGDPVHTAPGNLFPNPVLVDTSSHELVCIPTDVTSVAPVTP